MDNSTLDPLKQLHGYEEWRDYNSLEQNLLIWNHYFSGDEFPGWNLIRSQEIQTPGWPPAIQTLWQATESEIGAMMIVNHYQTTSRSDAHEFLVRLLGEFQSPELAKLEQDQLGDVAFAPPEYATVLFARANMVILMQNGEAEIVPMIPMALKLDEILSRCPEPIDGQVIPKIQRFSSPTKDLKAGVSIPLQVEVVDPIGRPIWFMFFSKTGEFHLESGRPEYLPAEAGIHKLTLCAINPNLGAAQEEITISVD